MRLEEYAFGSLDDGSKVRLISARSAGGLTVGVSDYGATLVSVRFPDADGVEGELTLGFDTLDGYLGSHPYFGATIGRYANRIEHGAFELDGTRYRLTKNDGDHHLHGGEVGFNRILWRASVSATPDEAQLVFRHESPAGHEGYPGNLDVTVTYIVSDDNRMRITYEATTDQATPVNLTNHAYWNLEAPGTDVRDHLLTLHADAYLAVDPDLIPTGEIVDVTGTPFDFTSEQPIGLDFAAAGGYDHNYIVNGTPGALREAARLVAPGSRRSMSVKTDQRAIQCYTSNMLERIIGRGGTAYDRFGAVCLETGGYDDAVNHPEFPSTTLRPGETYRHVTEYAFGVV